MNAVDLVRLQISLEYQLDAQGWLVPFSHSSEQAYYIVYQHPLGFIPYFNYELPAGVRAQLLALGEQAAFTSPENVRELITESYLPCKRGEDIFWSGYFTHVPEVGEVPGACRMGEAFCILHDGQEICRAISIRQDELCAEVYVETLPSYRRRGYGRQVVSAWAKDILGSGRIPFYSYRLRNSASAALAKCLGVEWFANVVAYEPDS